MCREAKWPASAGELDGLTQSCVQQLGFVKQIGCQELLHVVDTNWRSCEDLAEVLDSHSMRLRTLLSTIQRFKEGDVYPNLLMGGLQTLTGLDELANRLGRLRSVWPRLQQAISHAHCTMERFETVRITSALEEALRVRRECGIAIARASASYAALEDAAERTRSKAEDKQRWRALSQNALNGLEPLVSARVAAVLWLRGSPYSEDWEHASQVMTNNLDVAVDLEQTLVKHAGVIMRTETEHAVVQQSVGHLSALRRELRAAIAPAFAVTRQLANPESRKDAAALRGAVRNALRDLLAAMDRVELVARGCGKSESVKLVDGKNGAIR
mmetsp:Transcript_122966/g.244672  ORF Transcript_122966/g.244672 Transcript_122966/m.244672 type:complete len:327 (+) Transcript_122966:47-1027(+)